LQFKVAFSPLSAPGPWLPENPRHPAACGHFVRLQRALVFGKAWDITGDYGGHGLQTMSPCGFSGTNVLSTRCSLEQGAHQSCLSLSSHVCILQRPHRTQQLGLNSRYKTTVPGLIGRHQEKREDEEPIPKDNHSGKSMS